MTTVGQLVDAEVSKSNIDGNELRKVLWGGQDKIDDFSKILDVITNDPVCRFRPHYFNLDRADAFETNLRRINRINELAKEGKIPAVDMYNYGSYTTSLNTLYPTSVHHGMFESIVQILGSEEQLAKYWQDIRDYKIIGCYAQTEMGTGSNVQGLETEAIYDETTEEFIINSPTIKSIKFWPGDLGKMANHAVVFAKLIIKEESYGIHAFFVQIKDMDTHAPLKGIEIGDIGPKFGYATKDNGYMKFDKIRVPRSAILSRYVSVTKEGMIELKGDPRVAYATMLWIRVTLIEYNWQTLLTNMLAVCRYALMRTQFKSISNSDAERRIIDYQATQTQIIPYLAFGYANVFMGRYCRELYDKMYQDIKNEDFKLMNDLHVLASCLKAYYMQECLDGLYVLREICGGHGYASYANVGNWIEAWSPNVTLEGDGYVLYQQTTKKLIKIITKAQKGKTPNKMVYPYISEVFHIAGTSETDENITDPSKLLNVLKAALIFNLEYLINCLKSDDGVSYDVKWNKLYQVDLARASKLHGIYMSAKSFKSGIKHCELSDETKSALEMLLKIYMCDSILKFGEHALISSYINSTQLSNMKAYHQQLIEDIRPHLYALLESVGVHKGQFDPTIVSRNSTGYASELFHVAKTSPLNRKHKLDGHEKYVRPLSKKLKNFARI